MKNTTYIKHDTSDFDEIIAFFEIPNGTFHKMTKNNLNTKELLKTTIKAILKVSVDENMPAPVILSQTSPKCWGLKKWVYENIEKYDYVHYLKKLGLDHDKVISEYGFQGYHKGRKKEISETFHEATLANDINILNGFDRQLSEDVTINISKHTKSYQLFKSDTYQNFKDREKRHLNALKFANSPIIKGKMFCKYTGKSVLRPEWILIKNISQNLGIRAYNTSSGAEKTDIISTDGSTRISLKTGLNNQLMSAAIDETYNTFDYIIKYKCTLPKSIKDHLYSLISLDNPTFLKLQDAVEYIRNHPEHPQFNDIAIMDKFAHDTNIKLNRILESYPKLKYALIRESILGESKYIDGSYGLPTHVMCNIVGHPEFSDIYTIDEYIELFADYAKISLGWKSNGAGSRGYLALRIHMNLTLSIYTKIKSKCA